MREQQSETEKKSRVREVCTSHPALPLKGNPKMLFHVPQKGREGVVLTCLWQLANAAHTGRHKRKNT